MTWDRNLSLPKMSLCPHPSESFFCFELFLTQEILKIKRVTPNSKTFHHNSAHNLKLYEPQLCYLLWCVNQPFDYFERAQLHHHPESSEYHKQFVIKYIRRWSNKNTPLHTHVHNSIFNPLDKQSILTTTIVDMRVLFVFPLFNSSTITKNHI